MSGEAPKPSGTFTVADVHALIDWVERGTTEPERDLRLQRVKAQLFPEGLNLIELAQREALVEMAQTVKRERAVAADPLPALPSETPPAAPKVFEWPDLCSPDRAAYRRGSLHDGTRQRGDAIRERARGSPFEAETPESVRPRRRLPVKDDDER